MLDIRNVLHMADAIRSFQASPLQREILQPCPSSVFLCDPDSTSKRIVNEMVRELRPRSSVKLFLLHGPPGTGKSEMVRSLVVELAATSSCKVLVCTNSNSALDEIGHRLIRWNGRARGGHSTIKFVRIGTWHSMHWKLRQHCLERKVNELAEDFERREVRESETKAHQLEDAINDVLFTDGGVNYRKRVDNEALRDLMDRYRSLKERQTPKRGGEGSSPRDLLERAVLKESCVVLSTLENVAAHSELFRDVSFTCCVVDAATQCTESEVIQCLTPGVGKFVMTGDCQLLPPPVASRHAVRCGFGRSLFARLCLYFEIQHGAVPFLTLKEQFRMRPEICDFPSRYFYGGELVTSPAVKSSPLWPFAVYDVAATRVDYRVVAFMCARLLDIDRTLRVGVVVADFEERESCAAELRRRRLREVEANTLEQYQSREKDVVIVTCMGRYASARSDQGGFASENGLNVALTRARQCLIVLGHLSDLMHHAHWRALVSDAKNRNSYVNVATLNSIPHIFEQNFMCG